MSVAHFASSYKPARHQPIFSGYPTPVSIHFSPPPPLQLQVQGQYFTTANPYSAYTATPLEPSGSQRQRGSDVGRKRSELRQQKQMKQPVQREIYSPRTFDIISPSGKKQLMIFVERVVHITAQVEYGLVPADARLRRYDENGALIGNEGMELLSPKVHEDTLRGTFFFAERRSAQPTYIAPHKVSSDQDKGSQKRKGKVQFECGRTLGLELGFGSGVQGNKGETALGREEGAKDRRLATIQASHKVKQKEGKATTNVDASAVPTLLDQLVMLGVLKIIPYVRSRSREHGRACLVQVLLSDSEIGHSCSSPRHSYYLYEAPGFAHFKVCTACRVIPYRRGVFYCSEACLAADWPQHRIECGKTYEQLQHIVSMLPTIVHPRPSAPAHLRVQTHRPLWYRVWLWMGYKAETNKNNVIDLKQWKVNSKERTSAGCKDLLPGF